MQRVAGRPLFPHRVYLWRCAAASTLFVTVLLVSKNGQTAPSAFLPVVAPLPTDITSGVEGAAAVLVDPSLPSSGEGAEWMIRRAGTTTMRGWGAGALAGVLPLGPIRLGLGYERANLFGAGPSRFSAMLATGPTWLRGGIAVRRLVWHDHLSAVSTDISLMSAPVRWLRMGLGIDSLLAPPLGDGGLRVSRLLRAGASVQPFGDAWPLALAVDARVPLMRPHEQVFGSLMLVAPICPGLEAVAGGRVGGPVELFVGLRANVAAVDAELTGHAYDAQNHRQFGQRIGAQARMRYRPTGPRLGEAPSDVRFVLPDALMNAPDWFGSARAIHVPLVVRLHDIARSRAHRRVVLEFDTLSVGMATIESLREAIFELRRAGIEVEARLSSADARTFALAAACSRVVLDATGQIDLSGFASAKLFYGGWLHRYGVTIHALAAGDHKTGADGLSREGPRPQEANNRRPLLDAADALLTSALIVDRRLTSEAALSARQQGCWNAEDALRAHLIDAIGPQVDVERGLVTPLPSVSLAPPVRPRALFSPAPTIAVVPIHGTLGPDVMAMLTGGSVDEDRIESSLERIAQRPEVVGVVLDIDSPGGDVVTSERLWRAVRRVASHKPVVAALGDVAASGGYYVASAASHIVARRTTVTGSIGVYRLQPDVSGLLSRLGIGRDARVAGAHADSWSVTHALTDDDNVMITRSVTDVYDQFWARVRASRRLPDSARNAIAEGRVWLGDKAHENGLVDAIGDIDAAVDWLAQQTKQTRHAIVVQTVSVARAPLFWRAAAGATQASSPQEALQAMWQRVGQARPMMLYSPE